MKNTIKAAALFIALLSMPHFSAFAAGDSFTPEERTAMTADLKQRTSAAEQTAKLNQIWDVGFKVALLLIAIAATVGSAYAATYTETPPPKWLKISAFAFTIQLRPTAGHVAKKGRHSQGLYLLSQIQRSKA